MSSSGKKILMMTDANFLAHVSRCTEIAKILREEYGYEIVFAGDGRFMSLPRQLGFATDKVFTVPGQRTLELAKRAGLVSYRWWNDACVRSIWSDLDCIRRQRPDAVLGDMHWSAGTAAEMAGLPYISVTNAHWTNYFSARIRALRDHFTTRLFGPKRAERMIPLLRDYLGKYWVLPYIRFRKKHGLSTDRYRNILVLTEGDLTLLADIPEYGPTEGRPETMHYVGPIMWEPEMGLPAWFDRLDERRPTFYFTMGSTGYKRFFVDAIQLFGDTEYQVIITTGGLGLELDRIPKNCFVEKFAPGRPIMEKSHVVVNHGGNGTVYQAIVSGTPVIGIPYHIDQEINLQRVEELGIGLFLSERTCTPDVLIGAIETILRDRRYKENVERLKGSVSRFEGARLAAQHIDAFLSAS
jgi:MGT family glycosyltransferase